MTPWIEKILFWAQLIKAAAIVFIFFFLLFSVSKACAAPPRAGGHAGQFWPPDIIPHPMPEHPDNFPPESPRRDV